MTESTSRKRGDLYIGVDVGGTKIQATLADLCGMVLGSERRPTPHGKGPQAVFEEIVAAISEVLSAGSAANNGAEPDSVRAVGLAIPGVVDPAAGRVVVTPNMELSGADAVAFLEETLGVPVALGNDCNLGTLGEEWLGAARDADSAVGIFIGTGVGGGFVRKGKVWRGHRYAAMEIGHMVMEIDGPECGCGNRGCLEALASRTAIEREIRCAVKAGRKTALSKLLDGDLSSIRSGALRQAADDDDDLVCEVLRRASRVLGYACMTLRHVLDPEVIVLGGGVIEACSAFMLPIIQEVVESDRLSGAHEEVRILVSSLDDDAVALGAVALAQIRVGVDPFDADTRRAYARDVYAKVTDYGFGSISVGSETYEHDIYIRVSGKVRKRKKSQAKKRYGNSHTIGPEELEKACRGGPEVLFVGTGQSGLVSMTEEARRFLRLRSIEVLDVPTPEAAEAYNKCEQRKAALFHLTC